MTKNKSGVRIWPYRANWTLMWSIGIHVWERTCSRSLIILFVKLTGTLQFWDGCSWSKAKARLVRKNNYTGESQLRERIFISSTVPFPESLIGNWCWIGVVDNYRRCSWSFFTRTESQLPKNMKEFFENITSHGMPVKYLCCKNSGEHQSKLQKACKKKNVTLKYTTPYMPQLNGVMERIFSVIK